MTRILLEKASIADDLISSKKIPPLENKKLLAHNFKVRKKLPKAKEDDNSKIMAAAGVKQQQDKYRERVCI